MSIRVRFLMFLACAALFLTCLLPVPAASQSIAPGVGWMKKGRKVARQTTVPLAASKQPAVNVLNAPEPLSKPGIAGAKDKQAEQPIPSTSHAVVTISPQDAQGKSTIDLGLIPYDQASTKHTVTVQTTSTDTYAIEIGAIENGAGLKIDLCASATVAKATSCAIDFQYAPQDHVKHETQWMVTVPITATDQATGDKIVLSVDLKAVRTIYSASVPAVLYAVAGGDSSKQKVRIVKHTPDQNTQHVADQNTQDLKVSNTQDLEVSSIVLEGPNASSFTASICKKALMEKDKVVACDITVSYQNASSGSGSATLVLTIDKQQYHVALNGETQSCIQPNEKWLPLREAQAQTIYCFYNASSAYAFASRVAYTYNPAGTANVITGDLMSAQAPKFLWGTQFTFEGNASTSSCTSTTSTGSGSIVRRHADSAADTSGACDVAGAGTNTPSQQQIVQTLEKGGDFAIKATLPLFSTNNSMIQALAFFAPRAGFTVNGLSSQNTVTGGTEANYFVPFEGYVQLALLPVQNQTDNVAYLFADYRGGLESTSVDFARTAGMTHHNFGLQYFSAGVAFNSSIRVSAQRFIGPSKAFLDSSTNPIADFKTWQIGIQFTPTNVKN